MRNANIVVNSVVKAIKSTYNLTYTDYTVDHIYQWDADVFSALITVNGRKFKFFDSIAYGGTFYEVKPDCSYFK